MEQRQDGALGTAQDGLVHIIQAPGVGLSLMQPVQSIIELRIRVIGGVAAAQPQMRRALILKTFDLFIEGAYLTAELLLLGDLRFQGINVKGNYGGAGSGESFGERIQQGYA